MLHLAPRARSALVVWFALAGLSAGAHAQRGKKPAPTQEPAPAPGRVEKIDAIGLALTLPAALTEVQAGNSDPEHRLLARWSAKLGDSSLSIRVFGLSREEFGFIEPEDVSENVRDNLRHQHDASFAYDETEIVSGPFGYAPCAALGRGPLHGQDGQTVTGSFFALGGLGQELGYSIEVRAEPALDEASQKVVLDFLRKGVRCDCKARNPQWTDEEVKARWLKDAPTALAKKLEKPVRTKHYLFFSNTDAAKQMGDYMEKFYGTIQKLYPFPEVAGRRLMPVFLFRNPEEYYTFFATQFETTVEAASKSKGVASSDFYATYYDAPQDPVHIHEATHQIFSNRLRLGGGGSWLQEGVAEYVSTSASERTDASNLVKKERHVKLARLVTLESLLYGGAEETEQDKKGDDRAQNNYLEAALLVEFVHDSKLGHDKFLAWIHAVGECPPNNALAIERATRATLGLGLADFEASWIEYCKKR